MVPGKEFISYKEYTKYSSNEMCARAETFYNELKHRRSVRKFSEEKVPAAIIKNGLRAAGTAPSGANMQPWHFVVVNNNDIKKQIREAAEKEEQIFYEHRATDEWLKVLESLGTDSNKSFLEEAPYLIAIFAERYGFDEEGHKIKNYYVKESVGIATGILITALHHAGLVSLTHTPSPMGFMNEILDRPKNERPFLLLVVGYPKEGVKVPNITKKPLNEIVSFR